MRPALVVIDMQKRWIGEGTTLHLDFDEAVDIINRVAAAFRGARLPVIWVQDRETMEEDDPGYAIVAALDVHADDRRVSKVASDAFAEDGLPTALGEAHADFALLCGYRSEQCVLATARGAAARGFPYAILRDATLSPEPEAPIFMERTSPVMSWEVALALAGSLLPPRRT